MVVTASWLLLTALALILAGQLWNAVTCEAGTCRCLGHRAAELTR